MKPTFWYTCAKCNKPVFSNQEGKEFINPSDGRTPNHLCNVLNKQKSQPTEREEEMTPEEGRDLSKLCMLCGVEKGWHRHKDARCPDYTEHPYVWKDDPKQSFREEPTP